MSLVLLDTAKKKLGKGAIQTRDKAPREEETTREVVIMPSIPNFTPHFNRIARRHRFNVANKTENRVKDLVSKAKTPLGDKNSSVVYSIPCKCKKYG